MGKKKDVQGIVETAVSNITEETTPTEYSTIVERVCAENGVTLVELCKTLAKGLKAQKLTLDKFGDEHIEDDFGNQHKFLMTALELLRYVKSAGVNVQVVNISVEERELLDAYSRN